MTAGWQIAGAGALAFLFVVGVVPVFRRLALGWGITDHPAPGKMHRSPTPYLGGLAIALGALLCSFVLPSWRGEAATVLAAACLVSLAGLIDDIRTVRPLIRIAIEIVAAVAVVAAGARVQLVGGPVDFAISVAFLVVLTNAFNLLDNMDGALGSIGAVVAIALAVAALVGGQVLVGGLAVIVACACLGFLVHNWHPARIFMGDSGSLFLGFLLAVIALKLRTGVPHAASAIALLLILGVALFDTTLVVISRTRAGRPIYLGGTDHAAHRLMLLGLGPRAATAFLVGAAAASATLGVLVAEAVVAPFVAAAFAAVVGIVGWFFMLRVGTYQAEPGPGVLSIRGEPAPEPVVEDVIDLEQLAREDAESEPAPRPVVSPRPLADPARARRRVQVEQRRFGRSLRGGEVDT